jgi:hypothetical protein
VLEDGAGGFQTFFFYGTRAEVVAFGAERCNGSPGAGKTVTGTVVGIPAVDPPGPLVGLSLGSAAPNMAPTANGQVVTFAGVPDGAVDLIGSVSEVMGFGVIPTRVLIQRGLNPPAGGSLGNIDFSGPDSFAPEMRSLMVNNAGGQALLSTSLLLTANGAGLVSQVFPATSWYGVPAARLQAGDLHLLTVLATDLVALAPTRSILRLTAAPTDLTLTLGPALTAPTVEAVAAAGYSRARAEYPIQTEYDRYWFAAFLQTPLGMTRQAQVQMTQGYRGSGSGTVTLEVPDLTGVAEWNSDWGLQPGGEVTWTVSASGWTTAGGVIQPVLEDGNVFQSASRQGMFTP